MILERPIPRFSFERILELERVQYVRPAGLDPEQDDGSECEPSAEADAEETQPGDSRKHKVIIGVDEDRVIDEAIAALGTDDRVFRRGTMLVSILRDNNRPKGIKRPPSSPRIGALPLPIVRERLAANVKWIQLKEVEGVLEEFPAHPPMWAVNAVNARGDWQHVRSLEGVVESPVIRHDGTTLNEAGYDPITGLFFEPNLTLPLMDLNPTIDDARSAVASLCHAVVDFPFEKNSHRAAWVASVLTPFARFAYEGPTPLFLVEANTPGTGKGLLCDVIGHIALGREMSRMSYPSEDDEMRKNITATAIAGDRMVLIDNVGGTFGTPAMDAMLTANTWRDRMLGKSETTGDVPLTTVWYATGNNLILVGDISRRICPIRLMSPLEKPEERTDFEHANLIGWIRSNRTRLVRDCLTILRAYILADMPPQGLAPWGSYTGWSDLVRSAIVWAGMDDPAAAKSELKSQGDRNAGLLKMFIDGISEFDPLGVGSTVSELLKSLSFETGRCDILKNAIMEVGGKSPTTQKLGMKLHHMKGRVCGGKYIDRVDDKITRWFVANVDDGEFSEKKQSPQPEIKNNTPLFCDDEEIAEVVDACNILDTLP